MVQKIIYRFSIYLLLFTGACAINPFEIYAQTDREISTLRVVGGAKIVEGEIIADRNDNRDVNGTLTAGLRISSDLTGFTFESNNGIHKIQQKPGASLLYLSPNERVVEIYREGFTPFQLVLASHNIDLESGRVIEIQITGDRKLGEAPARVNISPGNAIVIIDGEENLVNGTTLDVILSEGEHFVQIQKDGYGLIEDTISVSLSAVNHFKYTLEEIDPIFLRLDSEPSKAAVYLDDDPGSKGRTPIQIPVYPGPHTIRLELDGYVTETDEVQISNDTESLNYNLQEYAGYLTISTTPANAGIILNGSVQANKELIKLTPGLKQLEIAASGYDPIKKNIEITLGDTLVENIDLDMITGNLILSIMQPDANVILKKDGKVVEEWQGSKRVTDLPIGNYSVEASLTNFRSESENFELTRDENESLSFNLVQVDGVGAFSIDGLFEDAVVEIKGRRFTREFDKLPVEIESLPYDTYKIKVSKSGFKTYETDLEFNNFTGSITLVDEFEPKTKGKAFFRSLFIPGTGHGYLGKSGRGFLYFLGSAAAIGYTVKSYRDYDESYNLYLSEREQYLTASSNFSSYKLAYTEAYESAQIAKDGITLGLTVLAVFKALETLDLLLQKSNNRLLQKAKLEFNPANSGISMSVNF